MNTYKSQLSIFTNLGEYVLKLSFCTELCNINRVVASLKQATFTKIYYSVELLKRDQGCPQVGSSDSMITCMPYDPLYLHMLDYKVV